MIGCEAFQVIGPSRLSSGMNVSRYCDQPCRNLFDFDAIHYIKIATLISLLCSSTLLSDLQRNAWERNYPTGNRSSETHPLSVADMRLNL
jgi:hypothetical protein